MANRTSLEGCRCGLFASVCNFRIENVFLIFWLIIGLSIAIFTPPGVGKDEETHIARAEQIAEGQFLPQKIDVGSVDERILYVPEQNKNLDFYGGQTDEALYNLLALRYPSVHEAEIADMHFAFPYWSDARYSLGGSIGQGEKVTWAFPNTSVNSPLCYLPYSLGYAMAAIAATGPILCVILMRIFGVVTYGLIVRFAIKKTPICKMCMFLVAILPNSIAVGTCVSADVLTNACTLLFLSYVLRFLLDFKHVKTNDYAWLGTSLCCLALLKMPYVTFGLLLILIFVANKMWKQKQAALKLALIGGCALIAFLLWSSCIRGIATYAIWDINNVDQTAQATFMVHHPKTALKAIYMQLCNTDLGLVEMNAYAVIPIPCWITIFTIVLFIADDVKNCPIIHNRVPISVNFLTISFMIAILIIIALYLTFVPVGATSFNGVQSRYFVPTLFPIFASAVMLLKGRCSSSGNLNTKQTTLNIDQTLASNISCSAFLAVYALFALWSYSVWL